MKYDLSKSYDIEKVQEYLFKLVLEGHKCELKKIHPRRSLDQNNYLWALYTLWGNEFGYTKDETAQTVKTALDYKYNKLTPANGFADGVPFYIKTSEMDTKELTIFIEKFRDWSAQTCDLYLPSANEYQEEQIYFDNLTEN